MLKSLTYVIAAQNHPDLLARTVLLLHRMNIPIHGLIMKRPQGLPAMHITIEVLAHPEQTDRIAANLAKLVHVVSIETPKLKAKSIGRRKSSQVETP